MINILEMEQQNNADLFVGNNKKNARKSALEKHLAEFPFRNKIKYIEQVYSYDDTVFCLEDEYSNYTYFKVFNEKECLDELMDWYDSDITSYCFSAEQISSVLSMPIEAVLALDLLEDIDDELVGIGTHKLLDLLRKMNKLENLAMYAKDSNFMILAKDDYAYKVGDYYVLKDYDYYKGVYNW